MIVIDKLNYTYRDGRFGLRDISLTIPDGQLVEMAMKKGQFFIFSERCMHGSSANRGSINRLGVNCRVTSSDTLIYPGRLKGEMIDGSNLDITHHECVLLSGRSLEPRNNYRQTPIKASPVG